MTRDAWVALVLLLGTELARAAFAADPQLEPVFRDAGWVFAGRFVKSENVGPPGGEPQTAYSFRDCTHYKEAHGYGPIEKGSASTIGVYGSEPALDQAAPGAHLIIFTAVDYGKVLAVVPATPARLQQLDGWKSGGALSREDLKKLWAQASRVVVVEGDAICAESYPCRHTWTFEVKKTLKGAGEPGTLTIRGSYKRHDEIPVPLKLSGAKSILFLAESTREDKDVLGSTPWSAGAEVPPQ